MSIIPKFAGERVFESYKKSSDKQYDVIVIGSGMGGMSCAATLSKLGKKVLVLEQHYMPGGFTHMFRRKGYVWDVGVHVMGEMTASEIPGKMLRWLSNDKVKMNSLGNPYDQFFFPGGFEFKMPDDKDKFLADLKEKFPDEKEKLDKYWKFVRKADVNLKSFFLFQTLPYWLEKILSKVWFFFFPNLWSKTTEEVLAKFGFSHNLKTALTSHWGYYGSVPQKSSFGVHALTHNHFWNGAYYPEGGAKVFAETLLANVKAAGGQVYTKAQVAEILVTKGKATGVRMADGQEFRAPVIVSAAGAKTTVNKLLPRDYQHTEWAESIRGIEDSPSYLCLNLGFKGDIKASGALPGNMWLYTIDNNDTQLWDVTNPDERPHLLYVSFPSLKDTSHDAGPEMKHTGECVTFVDWEVFRKWENTEYGKREADYVELKKSIEARLLKELEERIPDIMQYLDFSELSTPLTSKHFAAASQGAIYGLAATVERFTNKYLRTRTPIKNFYMSGVDIATLGVVSGMTSGIMTAAAIDKRAYLRLL